MLFSLSKPRPRRILTPANTRRVIAAFLGTFTLVFVHAGLALSTSYTSITVANPNQQVNQTAHGIGAGFSLTSLIFALGHVSGAHFNPSVSLAFVVKGDFPLLGLIPYWLAQCSGAFAAAGLLDAFFPSGAAAGSLGANNPRPGITLTSAFFLELIFTMILHMTVIGTATRGHNVGPNSALAVGACIGFLTLFGGGYGGGSMNPFRSLAPGVLTSNAIARHHVWIYVAAPFCSSFIMGTIMRLLVPTSGRARAQELHAALGTPVDLHFSDSIAGTGGGAGQAASARGSGTGGTRMAAPVTADGQLLQARGEGAGQV